MSPAAPKKSPSPAALCLQLLLLAGLLLWLGLARAAEDEDPPARAGRVAEVSGEAWLFDTEAREWTRVERNQTLGEGDRLRTEGRSRVSLRIGSTSLWLDEDSDLAFVRLDDSRVELDLERGSVALRLRSREEVDDYQLRTREGLFTPEREGLYRVDQLDRGSRGLSWDGSLRFDARAERTAPIWVQAGEQVEFWWANGPRAERQALARDEFADWLLAQREAESQVPAYRYVSPEMTGAEDLDRYGRWENSAEYGPLWAPTVVAVDWAPYRYGRWVWSIRWGWTWVDEAPWGFAPFHYGRWVHVGGRWCWAPGRYERRPVYAPALVAWVGGPAVGVGVIAPGRRPPPPRYGWVPLAPREAYVPAYRYSPSYWQRLNRDRDPVTVTRPGAPAPRPHRNLEVVGAVSALPPGGNRPQPVNLGQTGPLQPLTRAPGRGELPLVAPPPQGRPQPAFEVPLPRRERPERGPDRAADRGGREDWQQGRRFPAPVTPAAPMAQPEMLPQRPQPPQAAPQPGLPMRPGREAGLPLRENAPEPQQRPPERIREPREPRAPGLAQERGQEALERQDRQELQRRQAWPQRAPEQVMPQPRAPEPRPQPIEPRREPAREQPREMPRPPAVAPAPQVAPPAPPARQDEQQRGPARGRGEWQGPNRAER